MSFFKSDCRRRTAVQAQACRVQINFQHGMSEDWGRSRPTSLKRGFHFDPKAESQESAAANGFLNSFSCQLTPLQHGSLQAPATWGRSAAQISRTATSPIWGKFPGIGSQIKTQQSNPLSSSPQDVLGEPGEALHGQACHNNSTPTIEQRAKWNPKTKPLSIEHLVLLLAHPSHLIL